MRYEESVARPERHNEDMLRHVLRSLALPCLILSALLTFSAASFAQTGYTGADLQRMGQWMQFNRLQLYRLEIPGYAAPYAAALTSGKHGWRIVVFLRDGGVTNVAWDSGFLERPFQAASTDNFVLVPAVEGHFGVAFSGCKAQDCAHVYGALLYLPWSHVLFKKQVAGTSVGCSQSLLDPRNAAELQAIDGALRRQQAGVAGYRAPVCPGGSSVHP